jgi:GNAT superfamily N-acetyltransferase
MTVSDDDSFQKTGKQKITILPTSSENLKRLDDAITDYNIVSAKELPRAVIQRLDFTAEDFDGKLIGGIQAMMVNWGILQIDLLFVFEEYRQWGIGAQLLHHVEDIARKSGCYVSHLDTFDFQAKDFYLKHGYEIFGVLENVPKGHQRYYLSKKLD